MQDITDHANWKHRKESLNSDVQQFHLYQQNERSPLIWNLIMNGDVGMWTYCSGIYNYLCQQCLSPLKLWVRMTLTVRCNWYNIIWSRLVVFSVYSCFPHRHDVTQKLLKVALNTITWTLRIIDNQYTILWPSSKVNMPKLSN